MTAELSVPATAEDFLQGLGEAILRMLFRQTFSTEPPESALRNARNGNNVDAAQWWLASHLAGVEALAAAARRSLAENAGGHNRAATSFMSDLVSSAELRSFIADSPNGYLGNLVKLATSSPGALTPIMTVFSQLKTT